MRARLAMPPCGWQQTTAGATTGRDPSSDAGFHAGKRDGTRQPAHPPALHASVRHRPAPPGTRRPSFKLSLLPVRVSQSETLIDYDQLVSSLAQLLQALFGEGAAAWCAAGGPSRRVPGVSAADTGLAESMR